MKFNICAALLLFVASCNISTGDKNDNSNEKVDTIKFSSTADSANLPLSDSIHVQEIIHLQSSDSSMISNAEYISSIILRKEDNRLIVFDNRYMSIKIFDLNGNYIKDIGKLGRGKGEYINIQDVKYNSFRNSIWVVCNTPLKVIEFSMDGNLIIENSLPFYASAVAFEGKDKLVFYNNNNPNALSKKKNILYTNNFFVVEKRLFDIPSKLTHSYQIAGGLYSTSDSQILFNQPLSNVIYSIKNGEYSKEYYVDFGDKNFPEDFKEHEVDEMLKKKNILKNTLISNENFLGFNFAASNYRQLAFYNKKTKQLLRSDLDNTAKGNLFKGRLLNAGHQLILSINKYQIEEFLKANQPIKGLEKLTKGFSENPTLILFSL